MDPITYTGPDDLPVAEFAALLGNGLDAVFRFDAGTQGWLAFRPGAPGFTQTLARINRGDALFVLHSEGEVLRFADVTPPGPNRTVALISGGNFVGFTGPGGPAGLVLGTIPQLVVAQVFDVVEQEWLAFRPDGPDFLSAVRLLPRLASVFLVVEGGSAWIHA